MPGSAVPCIVRTENRLGEGPCWDPRAEKLYWCDIKSSRLHWLATASGETGGIELPCRPSAIAVRAQGGLLLATDRGVAAFEPATAALEVLWPLEAEAGFRSNDGKIDPAGRFWWSSMDDDDGRRPGKVLVIHPDGRCETAVEAVAIANTVAVAPDGRTFYLSDSKLGLLYAFELDPATAKLSNRRIFADLRDEGFSPDGGAVDAEGFLWVAHWGGWRVVRYASDGRVDRVVQLPVEQPTSCAFGGPALDMLYITSARAGLSEAALGRQPLAGGLFALAPGVAGLALPAFTG